MTDSEETPELFPAIVLDATITVPCELKFAPPRPDAVLSLIVLLTMNKD